MGIIDYLFKALLGPVWGSVCFLPAMGVLYWLFRLRRNSMAAWDVHSWRASMAYFLGLSLTIGCFDALLLLNAAPLGVGVPIARITCAGAWLALVIALLARSRPVRVVVLRSFSVELEASQRRVLQIVGRHWGRVDALLEPGESVDYRSRTDRSWGIMGNAREDRWQKAIRPLLQRARVVILDASKVSGGLLHELLELAELAKEKRVRVAIIASDDHLTAAAREAWRTLFRQPFPPMVTYGGRSPVEFAAALLDNLEARFKPFRPTWSIHRWLVMHAVRRTLVHRILQSITVALLILIFALGFFLLGSQLADHVWAGAGNLRMRFTGR